MTKKVLHYRWTYDEDSGDVELVHNDEKRRAETEYHLDVAQRHPGQHLRHGFADRIEGGWRITDWESKAEKDQHTKQKVIEAIREREGTPLPKVGAAAQAMIDFGG